MLRSFGAEILDRHKYMTPDSSIDPIQVASAMNNVTTSLIPPLESINSTHVSPVQKRFNKKTLLLILLCLMSGTICLTLVAYDLHILPYAPMGIQKATYLSSRMYLNPTLDDVKQLASMPNAQAAADVIFAAPSQAQEQAYQQGVQSILQKKNTYKNEILFENTLYAYEMVHDPDRARRKLYYLWENIFSVDAPKPGKMITLADAKTLHQMLYDSAYGNYIQIVKNVETNYAMAQYLDLSSSSGKNPNENFARELMQLFLIGQYTPLDTSQSTPNYSDQDVNSLAYILTGFTADRSNHTLLFDSNRHYSGTKLFLGEQYNDPQHAIDYIVQKKQTQASEFLSSKLLHYYVSDSPTDQDISTFASIIVKNNFQILPSLKWLITSNLMYSPTYMSQTRYKSPMELLASSFGTLFGRQNYQTLPSNTELTDLDFQPYNPGSIFGRDGFNSNVLFYSGTIVNRWIADTDRLLHTLPTNTLQSLFSHLVPNINAIQTPDQLVTYISSQLYLGKSLPQSVRDSLRDYLLHDDSGKTITFALSSPVYRNQKLPGLLSFMMVQPEFLTLSGNVESTPLPPISQVSGGSNDKLIVVRVRGGWDFQGIWANTLDPAYATNRKQMALTNINGYQLGNGYSLSTAAASLVPLLKSKDAFLVSSVGLPNHSRAHDIAGLQMESGDSQNQTGILGQLAQTVPNTNLISFSNTPPTMLRGSQSLQVGTSNLELYQIGKNKNKNSPTIAVREGDLKQIFTNRLFPDTLAAYYTQALLLDQLAAQDIAQGGKGTAGNTNETQLPFLEKLIANNIGNTYYLYADSNFDHHSRENVLLNPDIEKLFTNFVHFYTDEKSTQKLTIVFFSEFGRTDKINGSNGTDHGQGGGIVVLSNVLHWPTMVGTINPTTDAKNWTTVQVDERDVWSSIFNSLYGLPIEKLFQRNTPLTTYPIGIQ